MSLTVMRLLPAFLLLLLLNASMAPAGARTEVAKSAPPGGPGSTASRLTRFSPRVRRSTVTYLRLRLLELREEGLERARAAIERRLSIDDLLAEPRRSSGERTPPSAGTPIRKRESTP